MLRVQLAHIERLRGGGRVQGPVLELIVVGKVQGAQDPVAVR